MVAVLYIRSLRIDRVTRDSDKASPLKPANPSEKKTTDMTRYRAGRDCAREVCSMNSPPISDVSAKHYDEDLLRDYVGSGNGLAPNYPPLRNDDRT